MGVEREGLLMPMEHCHIRCCDRSNHAVRKKLDILRSEQLVLTLHLIILNLFGLVMGALTHRASLPNLVLQEHSLPDFKP